jgi:uncharacterized membrane protein YeaQ/YmgE (transglycosylase-associated protein family)
MSFETIAITAVVGLIAGWPTGLVMKSGGYGPVADTALGVVGGVLGGFVLWMQGIAPVAGSRFVMVAAAFVGAFILIVVQRKFWNVEAAVTK